MTRIPSPPPIPPTPPVLQPPIPQPPVQRPPQPPVWPKVIGIISMILGALGLLQGGMGAIGAAAMRSVGRAMAKTPFPGGGGSRPGFGFNPFKMFDTPDWHHYSQIGIYAIGALAGALLLWGGIVLLKRRPVARTLHRWYALLQTVFALGMAVLTVVMFQLLADQSPVAGQFDPMFRKVFRAQAIAMGAAQLLFGMVYPTFVLIWFGRKKIHDQVAQWPAAGGT